MNITETITSRKNPKILEAGKLRDRREREKRGEFFFEGKKLLEEAVLRRLPLRAVFVTEKNLSFCLSLLEEVPSPPAVFSVSESVYEKISDEKSPEGIFTVAKAIDKFQKIVTIYKSTPFPKRGDSPSSGRPFRRVILSSIQDPGNLGTIFRTAAAFGVEEVILDRDCADVYHRKTLRASMGALFSLPVTTVLDLAASIEEIRREEGVPVLAAALRKDARSLLSLEPSLLEKAIFVIGNEGHGLGEEILRRCDGSVIIPMKQGAESLNAATAASLLLFAQWQRSLS